MEQVKRYDGHHKFHTFGVSVWTNIFGVINRLDISVAGCDLDLTLYNNCMPYRLPSFYISGSQFVIADKGFSGKGKHIVFPYKTNQMRQ